MRLGPSWQYRVAALWPPAMISFAQTSPATLILLVALAVLGFVAIILAVIFARRRRSRRLLVKRVAELEALSAAGRAIVAAELDVDTLCNLIAEQAGQVIDNRTFQVGLFEEGYYDIRYWTIDGRPQPVPQCFDLAAPHDPAASAGGLVGWVRDSQQPLLVRDFQREMDTLPARPTYHSQHPPRSALFLPLLTAGRTLGIVAAQSERPGHFSEQDLRRLTILANQAAAAIANARLFANERTRAAHLELVTQIARQVNAADELDEVLEQVVSLTCRTFGFHPVTIFGIDPLTREMVIQASSIAELDTAISNGHQPVRLPVGQGIIGTAAATRRTVAVNNTREDERFLGHLEGIPAELNPDTQAEIAIPLLVNNELLGVLDVQSPQVGAFGAAEQSVLETLAAEVTSAIYKTRQLAREQEQAWLTTAQLQVAEAIGRHDDRDEMLSAVARLAPMLIGVNLCGFLLWDDDNESYNGATLVGLGGDEDEVFNNVRLSIGDWSALDAAHVGRQPLTTTHVPAWLRGRLGDDRACLRLYPLLGSSSRTLGLMLVDHDGIGEGCAEPDARPNIASPFDLRREELVQNVARQTAQGLESAYLRAAQQEEAWVNTALLQVAEAVNSLIDLNEILDTIVRLVPLLVGVDAVFILVWDEERQLFQAGPSYGVSTMGRGLVETLEIDRDEFLNMSPQLAQEFSQPRQPGVGYYAMRVPSWLETVLNTATAYSFPLMARGRLVGAMIVGLQRDRLGRTPFSTRRINILNGIAQQAATAVVNNQLYRESADRARMQQELDVAHTIQASFLPDGSPSIPGCSVATYWQAARQVGGDFYDFLPLDDDKWGIAIADVADKGVPAALFMALSRTILRAVAFSHNDPAYVLSRANEIIAREARSDLFVTVFYGVWDPATERFTYANAGHNPPLLMQPNGAFQPLLGHGMALGILPEVLMKSHSVALRPGETIILYTDGVTEALNEDYDEFGLERLQVAARDAARQPAAAIVRQITDNIRDHTGQTAQFDDMTLIVMKRLGGKAAH
ncbi:MAG: SpoIIE family protein phosphatase [Candidatus Promineofilum sp.]|nr:SpoIIE family protein phosphatase [Promineifilum sp.]